MEAGPTGEPVRATQAPESGGAARLDFPVLTPAAASDFARLVLGCARREYPHKLDHVMASADEVRAPRDLHPSFYGCFDWHSAVHGHWVLARLLRAFPALPEAEAIRGLLDEHLAPERVRAETDYFTQPGRRSFERTYGWAWLLKLAEELERAGTPEARRWHAHLRPLQDAVVAAFEAFLPRQDYPIRTGVHPNTAFSLSLALDQARTVGNTRLEGLLGARARAWYLKDRDAPLAWEPGGEDFLSPCLEEAALMAKVLPARAFRPWLEAFLPDLLDRCALEPARVQDRTDPKFVHLDGLNLSRARNLRELAAALAPGDPRREGLERCALDHAQAALPHVASGHYEGEHWLATFAVRLLLP